jgi:hypothetical protein
MQRAKRLALRPLHWLMSRMEAADSLFAAATRL